MEDKQQHYEVEEFGECCDVGNPKELSSLAEDNVMINDTSSSSSSTSSNYYSNNNASNHNNNNNAKLNTENGLEEVGQLQQRKHSEMLEFVLNNMLLLSSANNNTTACTTNNSSPSSSSFSDNDDNLEIIKTTTNRTTESLIQPSLTTTTIDEESITSSSTNHLLADDNNNTTTCKYDEEQRRAALALLIAIRDKYEKNLKKTKRITTRECSPSRSSSKEVTSMNTISCCCSCSCCCSFKTMLKLALILLIGVWCVLAFLSDVVVQFHHIAEQQQQQLSSSSSSTRHVHHNHRHRHYLDDGFHDFNHHNIMFVMAEPPALSPHILKEILGRQSNLLKLKTTTTKRNSLVNLDDVETHCLANAKTKCDNTRKVLLIQNNWLSTSINANVAKIVLEEMLGVCADIITRNVTQALEEMAQFGSQRPYAMLEFWSESRKFQYDKYVVNEKTILDSGELGINAKIGWYILGFMKEEYELIDEYREYRTEKAAHYLATNSTYPLGRFIGAAKSWINYDQQIITNLKLGLQLEPTPEENAEDQLISKIEEANTNRKPALFYFWYPHQIFKKLTIKNVYLPPSSDTCWTSYNQENQLIDCDYPTEILRKIISPKTREDSSLNSFFNKFTYESTDQVDILADIVYEKMSVVDASCKWLRNNTKRVAYYVSENDNTSSSVIGIVIASLFVISLFFCTLFVTGLILYFMYRKNLRKRALKYAPRTTPLTLVFTDIQNSTLLWATASDTMKSVLSIHNLIMRSNIKKYRGYEAMTAGDSFTVAFTDPLCALAYCISVQKDLLLANWPSDSLQLADMKEVRWNESLIYRGPRVRMGIHTGSDCTIQIDKKTQRMEYVGNMVHVANKIEASSVGGRIYCSGAFAQAIKNRLTLFDASSSNASGGGGGGTTPKTSKEDVTTSANTQYYDDTSDKGGGLSKYIQELHSNLIEFEDLGPKQEIDIGGTKNSLLMVKDFSFARTSWIQQFERVLEESPVVVVEEEQKVIIGQKLDLIEEVEKYITDPGSFEADRKSKLIYDFINHTSESDLNLPPWNKRYFTDLFDNVFRYITAQHMNIKEE